MPDRPIFPASLVLEVLRACEEAGVTAYVSGGWGIDAIVGHQTRDHHDLDLAVPDDQIDEAIAAVRALGFHSSGRTAATEKQQRETQAIKGLAERGFVVQAKGSGRTALYQRWFDGPDAQVADAQAMLDELGIGPIGLPTAELRGPEDRVIVLHRVLIDGSELQDPEAGPAPVWVATSAQDTHGQIAGESVRCVPATLHAMRLDLEFDETDIVLRDLLWLQKAGRLTGAIRGSARQISGAVPAAEVAAAYLRWWSRAFPGPGSGMVDTPDDPDAWADDIIDGVGIFSDGSTLDVEYGWEILLALVAAAADDEELGDIAAGPVEDFLSQHGAAAIERVEAQAAADPKFRHMLGGVWQLFMSDGTYARIRRASGDERW